MIQIGSKCFLSACEKPPRYYCCDPEQSTCRDCSKKTCEVCHKSRNVVDVLVRNLLKVFKKINRIMQVASDVSGVDK